MLDDKLNQTWAVIPIVVVCVFSVVTGFRYRVTERSVWWVIIMGIMAGVIGDTIVFKGSACGIIGTPILCVISLVLGLFLQIIWIRLTKWRR